MLTLCASQVAGKTTLHVLLMHAQQQKIHKHNIKPLKTYRMVFKSGVTGFLQVESADVFSVTLKMSSMAF
jgi:hypothetical protein